MQRVFLVFLGIIFAFAMTVKSSPLPGKPRRPILERDKAHIPGTANGTTDVGTSDDKAPTPHIWFRRSEEKMNALE